METLLGRNLNDREIILLITLLATLYTFTFTDQEHDKLLWGSSK